MTLQNIIQIWELNHPSEGFFDSSNIIELVDKTTLLDYIMLECSEMRPIDGNSERFHIRVENFFKTHKWNIDTLAKSINFDYKPLETYHGKEDRTENISTVENIDTDVNYHEDGSGTEHTVNLISGFNDVRSPNGKQYIDSEHDRQERNTSYERDGNSNTDTLKDKGQDEKEQIIKSGNDGKSYQSLIEEERAQAQFNLYKWILKHFTIELLVAVW